MAKILAGQESVFLPKKGEWLALVTSLFPPAGALDRILVEFNPKARTNGE
jgi:hypothetical protein